jgi:uncharacterized cupin superfamily protein
METPPMKPILNIDEVEYQKVPNGPPDTITQRYGGAIGDVARRLGATRIGANVAVIPAGKSVFPFHNHRVNEEFLFVLEGEGVLRFGNETHPLRKGDFVLCPPGDPEVAHQLRNTGQSDTRVLGIATKIFPDIAEYPDSGKLGVLGLTSETSRFFGRAQNTLSYWDGE